MNQKDAKKELRGIEAGHIVEIAYRETDRIEMYRKETDDTFSFRERYTKSAGWNEENKRTFVLENVLLINDEDVEVIDHGADSNFIADIDRADC